MKKAAILLADGFEEVEALTPVDLLRRAGVETLMVSVGSSGIVTGSHSIGIQSDLLLKDFNVSDIDLLILPGGMPGTKNLDANDAVKKAVLECDQRECFLAAICAAPSVFGHLGILKGRKATCYPGFEDQLEGAEFVTDNVIRDGHIITSRGVGTAIPFGLKLVELLVNTETAEQLAKGIVYGQS